MKNDKKMNEEAVSPVIATILMVAITVVLAGVLYVWASSLAGDSTGTGLNLYQFDADDSNQNQPSEGTDDALVDVTLKQGPTSSDLNWASIKVRIVVGTNAPVNCDNPGETGGPCVLVEIGNADDQVLSVGDGFTVVESGTQLCDAGQTCSVKITITDTREGTTLSEMTTIAE
jgi:flagellin-like protein